MRTEWTRLIEVRRPDVPAPSSAEADPRGRSVLQPLIARHAAASPGIPFSPDTTPDTLREALVMHRYLEEMWRGPRPGGSAVSWYSHQVSDMSDREVAAEYKRLRPAIINEIIRVVGRRYAAVGFHLMYGEMFSHFATLTPEELLERHKEFVGPARPARNVHPPADEVKVVEAARSYGYQTVSEYYDRQIEEAILCTTLATKEAPGQVRASAPSYSFSFDLALVDVQYQEVGGRLHLIVTTKEKSPRVTFERGKVEGGTDGN